MGNEELITKALREYRPDELLIRVRPGFSSTLGIDDSPTSFHFACKCKRVAGIQSSGLFEAMLVGRPACGYNKHQFMCFEDNDLGNHEDAIIAPIEFLNFVFFAYMVPMAWITDPEYLRFRNSNPSEVELYMRGFHYWTEGLSDDDLRLYYTTDRREYRIGDKLYFEYGHAPHEYAPYYCVDGFSVQEQGFMWSSGNSSVMIFDLVEPVSGDLTIIFEGFILDIEATNMQARSVYCEVNGLFVDFCKLESNVTEFELTIPERVIADTKHLEIRLIYSFAANPPGDPRVLAIAYRSVAILNNHSITDTASTTIFS
jgi:hypothetical protein